MKKLYFLISAGLLLASAAQLNAQCAGGRYHDFIFPLAPDTTANVAYGSNLKETGSTQILKMDVYQPTGDVATDRALIVLAHGGSFIGGTKDGPDVEPLAKDFAKMGYVVASIEYRLGMNNFPFPGPDSADATEAVMRAVHDGRAAVRYFRKNARIGGNTFGIDTNNIYFAGVSAGGFIGLQMAYLDNMSEFPNYIDTLQPGLLGGLNGMSGNPGYSSEIKAVVNICGAIGDTAWIQPGDEPVISFHGTNDNTVPYGSDIIVLSGFYPLLQVHGSYSINDRVDQMGIVNCFEIFEGADHTPEVSGGTAATQAAYYDTILVETRNFLEHFTCGIPLDCNYTTALGVNDLASMIDFNVYPNPANTAATIDLSAFMGKEVSIELYDMMGRQVKSISSIKADKYTLQREQLTDGIYFMSVLSEGRIHSKKIIFE